MYDVLIKNGKMISGMGNPWLYGDVAVVKDRIVKIGKLSKEEAQTVIDAKGLYVCPGFIDGHSHSDLGVIAEPTAEQKIMQGVTTENIGMDGLSVAPIREEQIADWRKHLSGLTGKPDIDWSWRSFADFFDVIDAVPPSINITSYVGLGTIRLCVMGMTDREATADEIQQMKEMAAQAMEEGARGISAGLIYPPSQYQRMDEVVEIVEKLTSSGRETWIPAGTIEATHREYKAPRTMDEAFIARSIEEKRSEYETSGGKAQRTAELQKMYLEAIPFNVRYALSNESSMTSSVVLKYDGDRFHWEVIIDSRSDSVTPSADLAGNYMVNYFNEDWNAKRVFAWDGQEYTIHAVSAGEAIVDASNRVPRVVAGPLTAGIVNWGSGPLSYGDLTAAKIAASEIDRDGDTQIELVVAPSGGSRWTFVLDPSKGYAVTSATMPSGDVVTSYNCSGYRDVGGYWVPTSVTIEQRDIFTNRLLRSDEWELTAVDVDAPSAEAFNVAFGADTTIEYHSTVSAKASVYSYSNSVDTDLLLAERLTYAARQGKQRQNCATASLRYATAQLGKAPAKSQMAQLVDSDGQTTLHDIQQCAQSLGLYCRAVQTDLAALEDSLAGCKAILHIPEQNHFVVLDRVDERYAWIVDLANDRFYSRTDKGFLASNWSKGTALLLSNEPVEGQYIDVADNASRQIIGGDGWSCTLLLQEADAIPCDDDGQGGCYGYYQYYFQRWGCEPAPSGTCSGSIYARMAGSDCYTDPLNGCLVTGIWDWYGMYACN